MFLIITEPLLLAQNEAEQSAEISDTSKSEQTYTAGFFFLMELSPNKTVVVLFSHLLLF